LLSILFAVLVAAAMICLGAVRWSEFGILAALLSFTSMAVFLGFCRNPERFFSAPSLVLWGSLIYCFVRYKFADIEYFARLDLLRLLVCLLTFKALYLLFADIKNSERFFAVLVVVGLGLCFYALYQYLTGNQTVGPFVKPEIYRARATGSYINPNHFANLLLLLVPLLAAAILFAPYRVVTKVILGYIAVMMVAAIAATISRGGYLALAVGLLALFCLLATRGARWKIAAVLPLILAGVAFLFLQSNPVWKKRLTIQGSELRPAIMKAAVHLIQERPLVGHGGGHFNESFRHVRPETFPFSPEFVHNDYLNFLVEYGSVGFLLLGLAVGIIVVQGAKMAFSLLRRNKFTLRGAALVGGGCALFAFSIHSLVDFNFYIPANALVVSAVLALVAAVSRRTAQEPPSFLLKATGGLICALSLVSAVGGAWYCLKAGREHQVLEEAERFRSTPERYLKSMEKAFQIEPKNPTTVYALGEMYRLMSWEMAVAPAHLEKQAEELFTLGKRLNALSPWWDLRLAMIANSRHNFEEAERHFAAAEKLDPNLHWVASLRGWHYRQQGKYAEAKKWFQRGLVLKPYDHFCNVNLHQMLMQGH
jgi:O-antigen ligase